MKKGSFILYGSIIGGALLISSLILIVVNDYKYNRDQKRYEEQVVMAEISNDYDYYKEKTESFLEERTDIVDDITDYLSFYSKIEKNYSKVKTNLGKYESLIEDIDETFEKLRKNCVGKTYYKYDIANKCEAYESGYEQIVNSFVRNLAQYNKVIQDYNKWTEEAENKIYKKQELFTAKKYKDYVDINRDGNFEGKNETKTEEEKDITE